MCKFSPDELLFKTREIILFFFFFSYCCFGVLDTIMFALGLLSDPLKYDQKHKIVTCSSCGTLLASYSSAVAHAKHEHAKASSRILSALAELKGKVLTADRFYDKLARDLIQPVEGLAVTEGLACLLCPYFAAALSTMLKHAQDKHGTLSKSVRRRSYQKSKVQRSHTGPGAHIWGVQGSCFGYMLDCVESCFNLVIGIFQIQWFPKRTWYCHT